MAWKNEHRVGNQARHTPSEPPRVQKALRADAVAKAPEMENEYLFDDHEMWNEPLDALPTYTRHTRSKALDTGENPYARKRASGNETKSRNRVQHASQTNQYAKHNGNPVVYASVIAGCMVVLAFIIVMMMPQLAGYFWKDFDNFAFINGELLRYDRKLVANYKQYRDTLRQDVIYQGIFVDGVHVGGMTIAQAEEALNASQNTTANAFSLNVVIGNKGWTFDNTSIPATRNLGSILEYAYAIGRQNTTATIGTSMTPFRERVQTVTSMLETYVTLKSNATYDHEAVRSRVDEIAAYVTREPVDSQIETFDPNTRTFTFTDDQPGITVDAEALYQQVTAKLDQGVQGETITITPSITTPAITKTDMMNRFNLVAAFTTKTTSDSNRNNNIDLACKAINGKVLMPGETFSFNESTGKRTTEKGYKSAGAIAAGQSIEEVGGGICQVSSTLFNAVARADLTITSRSPHAWPSTYVKIGEDATVNWPNLDFQFTNNKSTPVFVITYYKDRYCSAEIWGMTLGTGVTIDLESKILRTIEPSSEVKYVQNTSLAPGESKETIKARTGYVVDTYQVWYKDGQEIKRELLHTSNYRAYQRTVEYN